eukprot:754754-Prymnesium_polylepis.2
MSDGNVEPVLQEGNAALTKLTICCPLCCYSPSCGLPDRAIASVWRWWTAVSGHIGQLWDGTLPNRYALEPVPHPCERVLVRLL